ncbi:MAG: SMC-Scp complex subunit ScpB [Bryobacteraceae bacterium]
MSEQLEIPGAEEFFRPAPDAAEAEKSRRKALLEAAVYVAEEPLTVSQIAGAFHWPAGEVEALLEEIARDCDQPGRGLAVRVVAGGYKMSTKPEHHDEIREFVRMLKPPLKLSQASLETLALIAYKQPITAPEVQEIRGVQGAGVLKTLLDRKLITTSGRKQVLGRPMLYRTTKEFLIQFGLKDLSELPTLKEFEELTRLAFGDQPAEPPAADGT